MPSTISPMLPGSRYRMLSCRNVMMCSSPHAPLPLVEERDMTLAASFPDRPEGHAAQQVLAQQEGEDRHRQQDQERTGRDRGPVGDPRPELRRNEGGRGLRPPVGHHQRERIFVPGGDEAEHGG